MSNSADGKLHDELLPLKCGDNDIIMSDSSFFVAELRDRVRHLEAENASLRQPKRANPAVVGLAGFGATTMTLQFVNCGFVQGISPVLGLGFVFGGLAQLVAGFMEFSLGNNFGFGAFSTYGSFWISLAIFKVLDHFGVYTASESDLAYFLLVFTFLTFIFLIGSTRITMALFIVFLLLFVGFVLLDIAHFTENRVVLKIAGYELIACALSAWYVMAHIVYQETFGRNVLPVGPSLYSLIFRKTPSSAELQAKQNEKDAHV